MKAATTSRLRTSRRPALQPPRNGALVSSRRKIVHRDQQPPRRRPMKPLWRTHSCVPLRHSCRGLGTGVETSLDAARKSTCATMLFFMAASAFAQPVLRTEWRDGVERADLRHASTGDPVTDANPASPGETLIAAISGASDDASILVGEETVPA